MSRNGPLVPGGGTSRSRIEEPRFDANLLVALDAILRDRNLTKAGERLGRTQSAMSGALVKLRAQLDDPIIVRVGRVNELTPRAQALVPIVRDAVEAVTRVLLVRQEFNPPQSRRRFVVGASDYAVSVLTAPLLRLVRASAPGVSLDFVPHPVDATFDLTDLLRHDIVIASGRSGIPAPSQAVFRDHFVVIADRRNPLATGGRVQVASLRRARWVSGFCKAWSPVDRMFAEHQIEPTIARATSGFLSVPFLVAGTDLLGVVPERVARRVARPLGLTVVETALATSEVVETAYWHPNTSTDPGLLWLLATLRDVGLAELPQAA